MRQLTMRGFGIFAPSVKPQTVAQMYLDYGRISGRTCGECANLVRRRHGRRIYLKCLLMRITRGAATDVRLEYAACGKFEEGRK